jgi:hypothetical protein
MKKCLWIFLFFAATPLCAQNEDFAFEDRIYVDYIASVKFHIDGLPLSYPVIDLDSPTPLLLRFDDLEGEVKTYTYTIVHCDSDWTPSQLNEMEYLEGFAGETIRDYRFSFKTVVNFTHYWVQLPNQDMRWTKSGNYLLIVYEDEGQRIPVITRRFMVVDPIVKISPQLVRPAKVSKTRTHQEIDFLVDHEQIDIRTPLTEVKAAVLQNGRWDNAIKNIQPAFTRYRQLIFDHQDKIVFPAGKEFRNFDLRSLRSRSEHIAAIERYKDRTDVILYKDESRARQSYSFIEDINGKFTIETFEESNFDLSSDYASVFFSLAADEPFYDHDIYIVGEVTAWQLRDEFQMIYNNSLNAYVAKPLLKQGFYNYAYAAVPKNAANAVPDLSLIEGDWYQTENEYIILIYYRPFGSRYDQLIGARTFSSTPR